MVEGGVTRQSAPNTGGRCVLFGAGDAVVFFGVCDGNYGTEGLRGSRQGG